MVARLFPSYCYARDRLVVGLGSVGLDPNLNCEAATTMIVNACRSANIDLRNLEFMVMRVTREAC